MHTQNKRKTKNLLNFFINYPTIMFNYPTITAHIKFDYNIKYNRLIP